MDYSVKTHLTRDDIIRSGACIDGVDQVISRKKILMTSAPVDYLLSVVGVNNIEYVTEAAGRSGYGDGDGDGDGYGSGYGDGDGYGYSYGDG